MPPTIVYSAPGPGATGPAPDTAEYRDRAVLHASVWVDHAGNVFECFSTLQGNTTALVVRRYSPAGALTGEWTLPPPAGFKLDDFGVFQSGTALLFLGAAHEAISDPTRRNIVYRDQLPGVAVAYPQGQMPVGAETPLAAWREVEPPPSPEPTPGLTQAEVKEAAKQALDEWMHRGGNFEILKAAAREGVVLPGNLLTAANMGTAYAASGEVFAQLNNVVGAQVWKVLIESQLVPPERAPAWVRGLAGFPWRQG